MAMHRGGSPYLMLGLNLLISGPLPIGRKTEGELQFAGTAFLTLAGKPRDDLQKRIEKLLTAKPPLPQRTWRKPQWLKSELRVRVRHLQGGDTLRRASVPGVAG
jgi:hypothetical protein